MSTKLSKNLQTFFGLVMLVVAGGLAHADPNESSCDLAASLRDAGDEFRPMTPEMLALRQNRLIDALGSLNQRIIAFGPDKERGWKAYLDWEKLRSAANAGAAADTETLRDLLARFYKSYPGLEISEFLTTRNALRKYIAGIELLNEDDQRVFYTARIDTLKNYLSVGETPALMPEQVLDIGEIAAWLRDVELAPGLETCIRSRFSQPNAKIVIGKSLIPNSAFHEVDETTPINDFMFGSSVYGTAVTRAMPGLAFVDSPSTADIRIMLNANTLTRTTSYQSGVAVGSSLTTQSTAVKRLGFFADRLASGKAAANSVSHGTITSVYADRLIGWRLAEHIAWNRANELLPQAEAVTSQKVSGRLMTRLDTEVDTLVGKVNTFLSKTVFGSFLRLGFSKIIGPTSTSTSQLRLDLNLAKDSQLLAANARLASAVSASRDDLYIALHESMLANVLNTNLAGVKFSDQQISGFLKGIFTEVSAELAPGAHDESWQVTLADDNPLLVELRDNEVALQLKLKEIARQSLNDPESSPAVAHNAVVITVKYRLAVLGNLCLERDGRVAVSYRLGGEPSQDLAEFTERKATAMFPEKLEVANITIDKFIAKDSKELLAKTQTLTTQRATTSQGWLELGWRLTN